MSMTDLVQGSYGQTVEITVQEDSAATNISSFTTLSVVLSAPDGSTLTKTGSFKTDGTDGIVQFTLADGDLHVSGDWKLQVNLSNDTQSIRTDSVAFTVEDRL